MPLKESSKSFMHLRELPPPVSSRIGWPWTAESKHLPSETMLDGSPCPRISIVTPSYNQGEFIEETIRSVLLQGYPNLEYIIIDGGSTDGSIEIIKKYEKWLSYWVSEPDTGQADAINKGFSHTHGQWFGWINSDDCYLPNAFNTLKRVLDINPTVSWVVGTTVLVDSENKEIRKVPAMYQSGIWRDPKFKVGSWLDFVCNRQSGTLLPQQASFWRTSACELAGLLDLHLKCAFDNEFYVRLRRIGIEPFLIQQDLGTFRIYDRQISANEIICKRDELKIVDKWFQQANESEKAILLNYKTFLKREINATRRRKFFNRYSGYRYISKQAWKLIGAIQNLKYRKSK